MIKNSIQLLTGFAAFGLGLVGISTSAQAALVGVRLDEGLIRDTLSLASQSDLKQKVTPALQKAVAQSAAGRAIRHLEIEWNDWYSGAELKENAGGTGVDFALRTEVKVSFLPMGSGAFQRVHLSGPIELSGSVGLIDGEVHVLAPQVKLGLVLACQQWWPAPLCSELKRQVRRATERQVTEFNAQLKDVILVRKHQLAMAMPMIARAKIELEPKKIAYIAPACLESQEVSDAVAKSPNPRVGSRGWLELQFDLKAATP